LIPGLPLLLLALIHGHCGRGILRTSPVFRNSRKFAEDRVVCGRYSSAWLAPPEGARWIAVPPVPEPFSALTCLVPLQLFAYHLALARGKNPDSFRAEDPLFPKIRERVRL
jgi:hypothetical protein